VRAQLSSHSELCTRHNLSTLCFFRDWLLDSYRIRPSLIKYSWLHCSQFLGGKRTVHVPSSSNKLMSEREGTGLVWLITFAGGVRDLITFAGVRDW